MIDIKKERDSFFSQYGSYGYNTPYMYPNMNNQNQNFNYDNNLNERLNRIEKELANINNRLSKLENTSTSTDYNFANSMYMV